MLHVILAPTHLATEQNQYLVNIMASYEALCYVIYTPVTPLQCKIILHPQEAYSFLYFNP
jgi:hypothetical protein